MAKGKLIKKDIREMAQDAIIAGMVFQYHAVSVEQIAADTGASPHAAARWRGWRLSLIHISEPTRPY